ncbi:hypothetical protein FCV25MIE_14485 [Fagus crenata]
MSNIHKRLAGLREDEASEPPKPAPVSGTNGVTLKNQQPHQESSLEKQESQVESPAGAKELLVNEARLVESFLELPPMFSSVSENPSNSEIEYAISCSSEKGEAPEPKAKKSVKMQRSENESVFENPNVTKIATLKPCPLKPHQESSPEKQESQAESPAGVKELLVNEARLVESFLELPPMFSSISKNPSNSEIEYAISRSSEKGEAPELKAKKSVKMQRSENESVFENPNVTKTATLKPCPLKPHQESSPEKQDYTKQIMTKCGLGE